MVVLGGDEATDPYVVGGHRKRGRSLPGCLAVLVCLVLLVGGIAFVGLTLYSTHIRTAPKRAIV